MDVNSYLSTREFVSLVGYPLSIFLLAVSLLLLVAANSGRKFRPYCGPLFGLQIGVIGAGFLLIIYLHVSIMQNLPLVEPFSGSVIGRFYIPPWVESERVLYWLLLVSVIAFRIFRRQPSLTGRAAVPVFMLTAFMVILENPFKDPLISFHDGYMGFLQAVSLSDMAAINDSLRSLAGKMFGYYNSPYMWIHPPLLFFGYALFTISVMFLSYGEGRNNKRRMKLAYSHIKLGFLVLTIALLFGYPWALTAWKDLPWWWDPKVNSSILMWVLYSSYLHTYLYYSQGRLTKLTYFTGMFAFAVLLFTFFSGYFIPGVHSSS